MGMVEDLLEAPKARWVLAGLAAAPGASQPVDAFTVSEQSLRASRLGVLWGNAAGLLAEVHTLVEDWRYHEKWLDGNAAHAIEQLGPAEAYRPVAEALCRAPAAAWWWRSLDREAQSWVCRVPGVVEVKPVERRTVYGQHPGMTGPELAYRTSTRLGRLPAVELLADQRPTHFPRPEGWAVWSVGIKPDARVYEIHCPADWTALVERYLWHRATLCQAPHLTAVWPSGASMFTPAWDEVAKHYDGVRLSPAGWLTATSRMLPLSGRPGYTFCEGWPTERTLWFRSAFVEGYELVKSGTPVEFGYGRPCTGSPLDLRDDAGRRFPWWHPRRWMGRRSVAVEW